MAKLNKQEVVSNEDIVKQIIEDFTQRQQERKKFEANWQLNINFFVGNQYCDKLSVITDGMRIAGTNMQSGKLGSLKNGSEVIVDSGVAKLSDKVSFAGSIATMDRCLRVLCNDFEIDLPTASCMLSLTPAKRMGADKAKGSIDVGKDADLVIVDKGLNVKQVIFGGKIIGEN